MKQRVITGIILALFAVALLYFGGVVLACVDILFICVAIWEEFHALQSSGHRVVQWPTWVGIVVGVPLLIYKPRLLLVVLGMVFLLTVINVVFREKPSLTDICMSILPIITIFLPGLCIATMAAVQPKACQVAYLAMILAIPTVGDTFAWLVGSKVGGRKMCPLVSPHKTWSGAIGGLVGSMITAIVIMLCCNIFCTPESIALLPKWWQYILIGLFGGIASQMGDLFASLVKRYCGIKDFSNLFPGHGGMMDRLDSILFMAVVVFLYRLLAFGI